MNLDGRISAFVLLSVTHSVQCERIGAQSHIGALALDEARGQSTGEVAGRIPISEVLTKDFEAMNHVDAQVVIEKTLIVETKSGTNQMERHVLYDLTLGNQFCPQIDNFSTTITDMNVLSGGRSGSLVVKGGQDKFIVKGINPSEFYMMGPLVSQREEARKDLKASSDLYHRSLLSPVCWGLASPTSPDTIWEIMPNIAVPTSSALDPICEARGGKSFSHIFDLKGKSNNGPIRSGLWQSLFGKRADWEFGFEEMYPGGLTFQSATEKAFFLEALDEDLRALSDEDMVDYSLLLVTYGCTGAMPNATLDDTPTNATSNVFDFVVHPKDKPSIRMSLALIDFAMKFSDVPIIERWVGAKGWSSKDYGDKLRAYITSVIF